jgi:hypothetical protein
MRLRKRRPYSDPSRPPKKSGGEIEYRELPAEVREVIEAKKRELRAEGYRFDVSLKSPDCRGL